MNLKRTIIEKLGGDDVKKLLAALDGRKTVIGLVLLALPDICIQISKLLAMFAPVFAGLEMADWSARMAKWSGAILAAAGGIHKLAKILLPLLKDKTPPVAPLLLILALASPAFAQEQPQPQRPEAAISCGGMRFAERGAPDHEDFVCRLSLAVPAPSGLTLFARADYTRTQGTEPDGDLFTLATFRSIEGFVGGRKDIAPNLSATAFAGVTWNRDKNIEPTDPRLWTVAGGLRYTVPKRGYVVAAFGHHGPVEGSAFLGSLVYEMSDSAAWFGDVAIPLGATRFALKPYTVRFGVSARVKAWKF